MTRLFTLFLTFSLAVFGVFSGANAALVEPLDGQDQSFFWKIEKEGVEPSYLLGSMHTGYKDSELSLEYVAHLEKSDRLVLEISPEDEDLMPFVFTMYNLEGTTRKTLGETRYQALFKKWGEIGLEPQLIESLNLWAIMMLFEMALPEPLSADFGVDFLLTEKARELNKAMHPLEDVSVSIEKFSSIPTDRLLEAIDIRIEHFDAMQAQISELARRYYEGDTASVLAYANEDQLSAYYSEEAKAYWDDWFVRQILTERNHLWMPELIPLLEAGNSFIAVGALHLFGEEGLLNLLEKEGYQLTPIILK